MYTGWLDLDPNTDGTRPAVQQPPYMFGTTQVEVYLKVNTVYYIVPSLYKRKQPGDYYLHVFAESDFELGGNPITTHTELKTMTIGNGDTQKILALTVDQFYEKKEILREKIIGEAKRKGLTADIICGVFDKDENLSATLFKRKMRDLGFSLVDFRDEDLMVLDENSDGTISSEEFLNFIQKGYFYLCIHLYV